MKKLPLIFLVIFSFYLSAQPVIEFKATEIDFGEIESGKILDFEFKFKNTGDSDLIIKDIKTFCGCTAAKLERKEYKPGEQGAIKVKFFSRGYIGKVTKTITISTNDKKNLYTRLTITGRIILKDFSLAEVNLDTIKLEETIIGEKYTKQIKMKNSGNRDLRLIEIIHVPEIIPEFSEKIIKPQQEAEITITFKPLLSGEFTSFIKIRTNSYNRYVLIKIEALVLEKPAL